MVTVYTPLGMLGYGFPEDSLKAALKEDIDVIALDAGSIDPGPYYLGSGISFTSEDMVKRDMKLILSAAKEKKVPVIIGTAGGSGGKPHVDFLMRIIENICHEEKNNLNIARIDAEQPKDVILDAIKKEKIEIFEFDKILSSSDVKKSERIVAQMGIQPMIEALNKGVDIIVAGRAYDAAVIAAYPIWKGMDPGLSYHMGKLLECGGMIALPRESDGIIGRISNNSFTVTPADPEKRCLPDIVAAHTLYEKSNPFYHAFPGGSLDLRNCTFSSISDRTVEVKGSKYIEDTTLRIKLEGSRLVGYRNVCISGIKDPFVIKNIALIEEKVRKKINYDLGEQYASETYKIIFRNFGLSENNKNVISHDVGLIVEVLANSQQAANTIGALTRSALLHMGFPDRKANSGNIGFLYTPAEFPIPESYEFNIYHLMEVENLLDPFPIEYLEVRT